MQFQDWFYVSCGFLSAVAVLCDLCIFSARPRHPSINTAHPSNRVTSHHTALCVLCTCLNNSHANHVERTVSFQRHMKRRAGGWWGASTRRVYVNPTCQRNETLKNGTGSDKPMDHSLVAPMMTLSQLCIYLHNERLPTLNTALCIIPLMRPFFSVNIGFNLSYCTVEYTLFI